MRFWDLLHMSSSSLWKRKFRTVLTVLGVVIGTASIVVMISLGLGLNRSTMEDIASYGSLTSIDVYEGSGGGGYYAGGGVTIMSTTNSSSEKEENKRLDDNVVEEIKQIPHVNLVSPVLRISVIARNGVYESNLSIRGMSAEALQKMNLEVGEGHLPGTDGSGELELFYGNQVKMDFYNRKTNRYPYYETGEMPDIDLMNSPMFIIFDTSAYYQWQNGSGEAAGSPPKKYVVKTAGIMAGDEKTWNTNSYSVFCEIESLKTMLKRIFKNKVIPGQPTTSSGKPYKEIYYNELYVDVDSIDNVTAVQQQINDMGYQTNSQAEWVESTQKQYANIQAMLGGIGAVALLVAAIGITNTMMMSIYERTKEIGVMKVLGCDMRNIQALFLIEAGYIGFIGGVAGLLVSYGISAIINKAVMASGNTSTLSYIPGWLAGTSLVFAVLIGMVAGFFPSRRAMKLSPLAAIRNE